MTAPKIKSRPTGLNHPLYKRAMGRIAKAHVWIYRRSNGRLLHQWRNGSALFHPVPVLLLDHVGRRSGTPFTTPLLYLDDAPDVVIVASQGGMHHDPQWYLNLLAHPETTVQIRAELRPVRARVATTDEAAALWPRLDALYADFVNYRRWTDREIPIVVLEPR
ncbi:nitroreductase [Nocardioides sp. Root1257]|uniref:nitroreductase family deazaflavin-dependent oxidoreductase n=1 Tax=unclassified Nocardioides TaxID=2615069 RepID=UPI000701F8FD|nr:MULTISPECIES: nitroreductase family deazaflavin-dependent oxidoreductase [unclassified Nocardioides]KQW47975.1 nitroreductase [Nocardioides sp. Root1257]KRC45227.1 nitroreductase [Nocardioides sp. Root224]